MRERSLPLDGTRNLRELGGYITLHRTIKWGKLLRSGNLDRVPAASQQALIDYGVMHIVDVRDEWEQQQFPNTFTASPVIRYANIPLIGEGHLQDAAAQQMMNEGSLTEIYILLLERCQHQIKRIFEALSVTTRQGCTVIHCAAGKDRTGLVTSLLLGALGVSHEDIIQDYGLSSSLSAQLMQQWHAQGAANLAQMRRDASAEAATMTDTLHYLDNQYGGVERYLRHAGISSKCLEELREHLLE
jgi:protein-tyrosine phosphatase